jgi:GntR family transcriptional repressor for pyruvate dehydrogenase complex
MRRPKVYEEVAARLRQWIPASHKPGDTLPPERQLVEMFGVGRGSIRDALRELQTAGVVETRHGVGTIVCDPARSAARAPLADARQLQKAQLQDLIDFRKMIEPPLAARAAWRASVDDMARMRHVLAQQARRVQRGEAAVEQDCAFHDLIARAAHNQAVLQVLDTIMSLLQPTRELVLQSAGRPAMSLRGHREILAAIERRDAGAAEHAMRRHLDHVEGFVVPGARSTSKRSNLRG